MSRPRTAPRFPASLAPRPLATGYRDAARQNGRQNGTGLRWVGDALSSTTIGVRRSPRGRARSFPTPPYTVPESRVINGACSPNPVSRKRRYRSPSDGDAARTSSSEGTESRRSCVRTGDGSDSLSGGSDAGDETTAFVVRVAWCASESEGVAVGAETIERLVNGLIVSQGGVSPRVLPARDGIVTTAHRGSAWRLPARRATNSWTSWAGGWRSSESRRRTVRTRSRGMFASLGSGCWLVVGLAHPA